MCQDVDEDDISSKQFQCGGREPRSRPFFRLVYPPVQNGQSAVTKFKASLEVCGLVGAVWKSVRPAPNGIAQGAFPITAPNEAGNLIRVACGPRTYVKSEKVIPEELTKNHSG